MIIDVIEDVNVLWGFREEEIPKRYRFRFMNYA